MAATYTSKHAAHESMDYEGNEPVDHGMKMPVVDDVTGCGPASTPNDVTGHAGNLQSAAEAAKL